MERTIRELRDWKDFGPERRGFVWEALHDKGFSFHTNLLLSNLLAHKYLPLSNLY